MKKTGIIIITCILASALICSGAFADGPILQNGGFDGGLSSWETYMWEPLSDLSASDDGACIVSYDYNDARFTQKIAVEENTIYRISVQAKASAIEGDSNLGAYICADMTEAISESVFDTGGKWYELVLYGQTAPGQTEIDIHLCLGGYGRLACGTVLFDDAKVEAVNAVPEGVPLHNLEEIIPVYSSPEQESGGAARLILSLFIAAALGWALFAFGKRGVLFKRFSLAQKVTVILLLGLAVRLVLVVATPGHPSDVSCFNSWSELIVQYKGDFYTQDFFADYPPGYMYILYIMGQLVKLLGVSTASAVGTMLVNLPAILCDLALAYLACRYTKKHWGEDKAAVVCAVVAFCPAILYDSVIWHQVDSVLAVCLVASFILLEDKKYLISAAVYGLALLIKPQALILGPVFAVGFILPLFDKGKNGSWKKAALNIALGLVIALGVTWLGSLPLRGDMSLFWIVEKYLTTASQYPYATVNAFNLFGVLGGNWVTDSSSFLLLTYKAWGIIFIAASTAVMVFMAVKARRNGTFSLMLLGAFYMAAVFMLAHSMHERYIFPGVIMLFFAYAKLKDKRLWLSACALSSVQLLNMAVVLYEQTHADVYASASYGILVQAYSFLSLCAFAYFAYVCWSVFVKAKLVEELPEALPAKTAMTKLELPAPFKVKRWKRMDWILCCALTAVYTVVAFINLGTTQVPETYYIAGTGQNIGVEFGEEVNVAQIWSFTGISEGSVRLLDENDDTLVTVPANYDVMYRWTVTECDFTADRLVLVSDGMAWINELVFVDAQGNVLERAILGVNGVAVSDEQSQVGHIFDEVDLKPDRPSYLNGMYFDELYHGRTAYEHLNGLTPYENTHPPLGKVFIMVGIALFGMNPFGWRCVGALFGVLMVPMMYLLAKQLLKNRWFAFGAAFLFTFDFMHFAQTRLATIDVYGVFFILCMYYFMLKYWQMNFFVDGFRATLKPLGLCGLFFGIGAASKWICLYAGAGLAVIFFISLFKRCREYHIARGIVKPNSAEQKIVEKFPSYAFYTLGFCILAFIIVPVCIYILSYLPYFLCKQTSYDLKGVWGIQEYMFSYHKDLTATHDFQSKWYMWMTDLRPIWYYNGSMLPEGVYSSISSFGNPVVWWSGLVGMIALVVSFIKRKGKDSTALFLIIGFAAQLGPWLFISRATFIYHYFASVPFILLALCYLLERWHDMGKKWPKRVLSVLMAAALGLFVMFYPAISGMPVSEGYARALMWFDSWNLYYIP